jgi:fatty-acyl-CoA synthase
MYRRSLGAFEASRCCGTNDVYMPITPMFHVHAWGCAICGDHDGAEAGYPGRYDPNSLVRLYRKENVTFSHCVPTILQMILNCEKAPNTDFDGWKMLIGGSALTLGVV